MHDTGSNKTLPPALAPNQQAFLTQAHRLLPSLCEPEEASLVKKAAGRPARLSDLHLWMGLLYCLLAGMRHQRDLWRLISWEGFWHFEAIPLCDQAIYKRLSTTALSTLERLWITLSARLARRLAPYEQSGLAPFAREVLAMDETVLDPLARLIAPLRGLPIGAAALLPGKIAALFDIRKQQWRDFRFLPNAAENCKVHASDLLVSVSAGCLLLFDRGYFSYPFFDQLGIRQIWWICRYRERIRTRLLHVHYQRHDLFDGLVFLLTERNRAAFAVRLLEFRWQGVRYRYLTNVLDPNLLSLADIVRLYECRWDIELAFRALKEHLGLRLMWSSKLSVIQVQCLACLILVQLLHAMQVELAARSGVDPFEVSIPILLRALPRLMRQSPSTDAMEVLLEHGRHMGLIRPSSRLHKTAPAIALWQIHWPDPDLPLVQQARYSHSQSSSGKKKGPPPHDPFH